MKNDFITAENEYMKKRLWALTQIGKFVGIETMLSQIKDDEKQDLKNYIHRFYLNTNGLDQEREFKAWGFQQEGRALGYRYLEAIRDYIYK